MGASGVQIDETEVNIYVHYKIIRHVDLVKTIKLYDKNLFCNDDFDDADFVYDSCLIKISNEKYISMNYQFL